MAKKDKIDFGGVTGDPGSGGGGAHVPEGTYLVKVITHSKGWKDNDRSNVPYYRWTFQILEPKKFKGKKLTDITTLKPEGLFNLRNLIWACLGKNVAGKTVAFDPETLYGKKVAVDVEDDERGEGSKKKVYSSIAGYLPAKEYGTASDDDEDDDDDDDDEEEEEDDDDDLEDVDIEDV